jgi:N-acyl-phosphatidylethanolamine-hydrolysing phospholipase D
MLSSMIEMIHLKFVAAAFAIFGLLPAGCSGPAVQLDKPHHTEHGFKNIQQTENSKFGDFLKWRWERLWKNIPAPPAYDFPIARNDPEFLKSNRTATTLTWIGHATVLLQLDGQNILTDPHFSERASPVSWAGPKRVVPPGLTIEKLPPIDMVLISHDHYDSLDDTTIKALFERDGGDKTMFFVPLGLKDWFRRRGIDRVIELDWWQNRFVADLEVVAVPVQHWSKRSPFSRNQTLWSGWVVRSRDLSFFFAGDSGYTPHFREIGEKYGPFDLAAIPIGAYEPRWFMKKHHMNPQEAVMVHQDVRSRKSIAIHWGTFSLTDEPLDEPPRLLARSLRDRGIDAEEFLVLKHGETLIE